MSSLLKPHPLPSLTSLIVVATIVHENWFSPANLSRVSFVYMYMYVFGQLMFAVGIHLSKSPVNVLISYYGNGMIA